MRELTNSNYYQLSNEDTAVCNTGTAFYNYYTYTCIIYMKLMNDKTIDIATTDIQNCYSTRKRFCCRGKEH